MMNKRAIVACLGTFLLVAAAGAAQTAKLTTETGFVAAVSDSKITLSNVPLGGGPGGGNWQGAGGPGKAGETRTIAVRRGPDGKPQEVELSPEEAEKLRAQAKTTGGPRMVVRDENGQTRELTPEEAEKMREKMKAEGGGNVQYRVGPAPEGAAHGGAAARSSEPMKLSDFVVDGKTKKKGDIKVGARVTVTFREENGQKVATNILPVQ